MQLDFSTALTSDSFLLGQQYDSSMSQVISYPASEEIKFGQAVTINFDQGTVAPLKYTGSAWTSFHGIALRTNYQNAGSDISTAPPTTVTDTIDSYPKGAMVSIMKVGRIVVAYNNTGIAGTAATVGGSYVWYNGVSNATNYVLGRIAVTTVASSDPFNNGTTVGKGVVIGYTVAPATTTIPSTSLTNLVAIQIADLDANSPLTTLA